MLLPIDHGLINLLDIFESFRINYLQAGEEVGQLDEERQKDKSDEACLRWWLGYFVSIHEGGDWETL